MIGIYKITNPTSRVYIGQSTNINRRFKNYSKLQNCNEQIRLYRSFIKYGVENHIFEIVEECLFEDLNNRERYYQDLYNVLSKKGLNCYLTETNLKPRILSKLVKRKISNSLKGKINSEESKIKTSNSKKGQLHSEETKLKMSIAKKGKKHINRFSRKGKKVINLETNIIYNSATEAAKMNNINKITLMGKLNGNQKNDTIFIYI